VHKFALGVCPEGGPRGEIVGMSQDSSRRLRERLMRVDWQCMLDGNAGARKRLLFVTLTMPGDCSEYQDWKEWKRKLKAFVQRLRDRELLEGGVWRLELRPRLSGASKGEIAPHFHLVLYLRRPVALGEMQAWVSRAWYEIVGSGQEDHLKAGTQCIACFGPVGKLVNYLAKYLVKTDLERRPAGRTWGLCGSLPAGECSVGTVHGVLDWACLAAAVNLFGSNGEGGGSPYLMSRSADCPGYQVLCDRAEALQLLAGIDWRPGPPVRLPVLSSWRGSRTVG
jgi:hypothetical protein